MSQAAPRLSPQSQLPPAVQAPGYRPEAHGIGILHFGMGAFHRAHQALYTDAVLTGPGGDWRILGVNLRSDAPALALNPQGGRYSVITRGAGGGDAIAVIGSIAAVITAANDPQAVIAAIADPHIHVITLTITEKGYALDLKDTDVPQSVPAFLVAGLAARRAAAGRGLTILSCDNLSDNGKVAQHVVLAMAQARDPALAAWIRAECRFPSSMVDRITPAATDKTRGDAERLLGYQDLAAIETEPFCQWVIEDDFAGPRPAWDQAGALFVPDVHPYEQMKLRLLNGSHSLLAYGGALAGYELVSEAIADPKLRAKVEALMQANREMLPALEGIDFAKYCQDLLARFANPALRHRCIQIAMDGTAKLPPRIIAPLVEARALGRPYAAFLPPIAAWMAFVAQTLAKGQTLSDPQASGLEEKLAGRGFDAKSITAALLPVVLGQGDAALQQALAVEIAPLVQRYLDR